MKVKTYRAATLREALDKVKRDLGADAFILGQREIRPSNLLGLVQKSRVEVTAAVDPSSAPAQNETPKKRQGRSHTTDAIEQVKDRVQISDAAPAPPEAAASPHNEVVLDEIRKLNAAIRSMSTERPPAQVVWLKSRRFPTSATKELYATLVAAGIDEKLASSVAADANGSIDAAAAALAARIRIHNLLPKAAPDRTQVVAFLGPTGVGKTTTIAKIAADAAFNRNLKVGLITLDNFRIAAIEQLKTYGEIMGISVHSVAGVHELPTAIKFLSDRDIVLIDTAGRSHREVCHEWELATFLHTSEDIQKVLVLSATTRASDLAEIVDQYELFGTNCLVFTKLDETATHGAILNELVRSGKPLAYVTVGQTVPLDIVKPEARQLADVSIGPKRAESWTRLIQKSRPQDIPHSSKQTTKTIRRQV
jgi:flagellar biosynthesis protein FlhF